MWGFAHLVDRPGARIVTFSTLAPKKSKGVENRHNVARAFEKAERRRASVGCLVPGDALIAPRSTVRDFACAKWSLAKIHALE
jgi:hypothetical protein